MRAAIQPLGGILVMRYTNLHAHNDIDQNCSSQESHDTDH